MADTQQNIGQFRHHVADFMFRPRHKPFTAVSRRAAFPIAPQGSILPSDWRIPRFPRAAFRKSSPEIQTGASFPVSDLSLGHEELRPLMRYTERPF